MTPKPSEAEADNWGDWALPEDPAIAEAFPTRSGRHDLYAEAMRLVGAKRSKGALVALVNWLLHRAEAPSRIEAKRPLSPDVLANALQDRVHPASGRLLSASPAVAKADAVREALVNLRKAGDLLWPVIFGETDMSWAEAYAFFCEASENADKALAGAGAGERDEAPQYTTLVVPGPPESPADKLDEWQRKFDLVCDLHQGEYLTDEAYERVKASLVRELHAMTGKEAP